MLKILRTLYLETHPQLVCPGAIAVWTLTWRLARAGAPNTETECYWPLIDYSRTESLVKSSSIIVLGCTYHDHVEPCLGVLPTSKHHFTVLAVDLQLDG